MPRIQKKMGFSPMKQTVLDITNVPTESPFTLSVSQDSFSVNELVLVLTQEPPSVVSFGNSIKS